MGTTAPLRTGKSWRRGLPDSSDLVGHSSIQSQYPLAHRVIMEDDVAGTSEQKPLGTLEPTFPRRRGKVSLLDNLQHRTGLNTLGDDEGPCPPGKSEDAAEDSKDASEPNGRSLDGIQIG